MAGEKEKLKLEIKDFQEQLNAANCELLKLKKMSYLFECTFSTSQQQGFLKGRCSYWSPEDIAKVSHYFVYCIKH